MRKYWLEDERFSVWIQVSTGNEKKASWKFCNWRLVGGITQVRRHGNTDKEKKWKYVT